MEQRLFRNGERVKTCEKIHDIPVGTPGMIKRTYHSLPGTYDVQFDGREHIYTVWGGHLEPVAEKSRAAGL